MQTTTSSVPTESSAINYLFINCKSKLKTDRTMAKEISSQPDFITVLNQYMIGSRFNDDDLILFNWFIGTTFHMCVNELKKLH